MPCIAIKLPSFSVLLIVIDALHFALVMRLPSRFMPFDSLFIEKFQLINIIDGVHRYLSSNSIYQLSLMPLNSQQAFDPQARVLTFC